MHRTVSHVFEEKKPFEENPEKLQNIVAECIRLTLKSGGCKKLPSSASLRDEMLNNKGTFISSFYKRMPKEDDSEETTERNYAMEEIFKGALSYDKEEQAEAFIVRYVSMVATYPSIESRDEFAPLRAYMGKEILPKMREVYAEHPNRGLISSNDSKSELWQKTRVR